MNVYKHVIKTDNVYNFFPFHIFFLTIKELSTYQHTYYYLIYLHIQTEYNNIPVNKSFVLYQKIEYLSYF